MIGGSKRSPMLQATGALLVAVLLDLALAVFGVRALGRCGNGCGIRHDRITCVAGSFGRGVWCPTDL